MLVARLLDLGAEPGLPALPAGAVFDFAAVAHADVALEGRCEAVDEGAADGAVFGAFGGGFRVDGWVERHCDGVGR